MGITVNTMNISALNIPGASSAQKGDAANISIRDKPIRTSDTVQSTDREQMQANKIEKHAGHRHFSIAFSTYGTNNEKISITVTDKETGKVIREIPPEEIQRLSVKLGELAGMFVDDTI
ncbi:MAG: flagellar protein FlaG [Deltaproteobacteria bacterium]|nr:flagellar protein FlaG [Deltaproteobacteria bacterium]